MLGTLEDATDVLQREKVDQLYVALPLDEHVKMLALVESANRELLDIKVVPDLLQMIALRARLEDLEGIPIINLHDVPLRGFNAVLKRLIDVVAVGDGARGAGGLPLAIVCAARPAHLARPRRSTARSA